MLWNIPQTSLITKGQTLVVWYRELAISNQHPVRNAEPVFFIKVSFWNKKVPSSEQLHNFYSILNNIRGIKINYEMERTCNMHGKWATHTKYHRIKTNWENLHTYGRKILKYVLKWVWKCGLDVAGSGQYWEANCCEQSNEPVGTPTCHHISFPYSAFRFTSQLSFLCLHTNPHTDSDNSNLTTTARHSLASSIPTYLCQPYGPFQGPSKQDYVQRAMPTSSGNQPMAEQAGQRATGIKRGHSDQQNSFIRKGVSVNSTSRKDTSRQKTRRPTARPRRLVDRAHHRSSRHPPAALSTSRSLLNSTADLRPVNRVASGTSSLAADQRPSHYMATQFNTAVIITQQQTKTKSRQVSHKPSQARLYYARH